MDRVHPIRWLSSYRWDIAVVPWFANIHDDPRWLPFLRKVDRAPEQFAAIKFDVTLP